MIRKVWVSQFEKFFNVTKVIGAFLLTVFGAALAAKPENYSWLITKELLTLNHASAFIVIPTLSILVGVVTFLKSYVGSITTWNIVASVLEEYKKAVVSGRDEFEALPEHHIRVTLYKYVWFRFCTQPLKGWLVPVARTGHMTITKDIPRFRVPKGDPDAAEGVAGQAFSQNRTVPVFNLPDVNVDTSAEALAEYAEKGRVTLTWLKKRKNHNSRALLGVPVEVKGKVWGSLVIDSRQPDEIITKDMLRTTPYKILANVLGKLLEN